MKDENLQRKLMGESVPNYKERESSLHQIGNTIYFPWKPKNNFTFPTNPIINLEIGSGHGDWIIQRALSQPNATFYGIENKYERVQEFSWKSRINQLRNLWTICGNGQEVIKHFESSSIEEIRKK